jgi:hypothetical protein
MDGLGPEAVQAVTASHVGRGVEGMDAAAAKAAAMKATAMKSAPVKTAATMKATAAVKASTVSAAPVTATTRSLGNVRERQSQNGCQQGARKNPGEHDAFAVPSSQHVCLHRNRR